MKKIIPALIICLLLFTNINCKKEKKEDPHKHSLLNKSLDQIRAEIKGSWHLRYGRGYSATNTFYSNDVSGNNHHFHFLNNDTLKIVKNGITQIYQQGQIYKDKFYEFPDSVYVFNFGFITNFVMKEIKNDTLVIYDPMPKETLYFTKL